MSNLFINYMREVATLSLNQYAIFQDAYMGVNIFLEDLGATTEYDILFKPPTSKIRAYPFVEINGDAGHYSWTYEIDNDKVSVNGTQVFAANRDREAPRLSEMLAYTEPTWDDTGAVLMNRGMTPQDGPQSSANPFTRGDDFFKLNPEKYYIFKLYNRANNAATFVLNFTWFEFDPLIGKITG